jgi:hypothetical protein
MQEKFNPRLTSSHWLQFPPGFEQYWLVAGFLAVVPQLFVSEQVLVWLLFVHPDQSAQLQFSWQHD